MKRILSAVLFGVVLGLATSLSASVTVLKAARYFDASSGVVRSPAVIVVEGGKIVLVGSDGPVPEGATVTDLGDATLLPGFIDAHVHLTSESSDNWYKDFYDGFSRFPAEQAHYAAANAKKTLLCGFTTVRDVGAEQFLALGLRNAINAGVVDGPRMLISNYAVGSTGGHGDSYPLPPEIVRASGTLQGVGNGPAQMREAVRQQIKYGADVIKFMPSGGVLSLSDPVDAPELTQEEMDAVVSEAHAWGRKVAAHCHGDTAAKMAIKAGADSIEHGSFLRDDTLQLMKEKGVYLVPTLSALYWVGTRMESFPPVIKVKAEAARASVNAMFEHAVKIGVPVALGTDAAVGPHGENFLEFKLMVERGFTPTQALQAGTLAAARLLGLDTETGSLEKGKSADIVGVPGDPTREVEKTGKVFFVMRAGKVYRHDEPKR